MIKEIWKDIKGFEGKYQVSNKGDYIGTFNNQHEAARELNIKQSKVADILIGRRKSNHGYSFRYVTN